MANFKVEDGNISKTFVDGSIQEAKIINEKTLVEELNNFITKNYGTQDRMIKAVTVKRIDLSWFLNYDMKFLNLPQILNKSENQSIFVT